MYKIKPHETLQKLGFKIDKEGIDINPNDAFLYDTFFDLIGKCLSINLDTISDEEIVDRFIGMSIFVKSKKNVAPFIGGLKQDPDNTRRFLKVLLNGVYEQRGESA